MKRPASALDELLCVAAAEIDADGALIEANAGFWRLLPRDNPRAPGARLSRFFIQPAFPALRAAADREGGYRGPMTLGDRAGKTRTLRGRLWREGAAYRLLAEYDIEELERLNEAILDLNRDASAAQHALTRDNLDLKRSEARMLEDSLTDALTGVGNRRGLEQDLAAEITRARRAATPLCAIVADIDHFKRVNDDHGHAAGDQVLMRFGALLKSLVRPTDVVARFGGEEFVVLLPGSAIAAGLATAERLRAALAAEVIAPLARPMTASFGVSQLQGDEDGAALIARADAALYRAKEGGRNRVVAGQ